MGRNMLGKRVRFRFDILENLGNFEEYKTWPNRELGFLCYAFILGLGL